MMPLTFADVGQAQIIKRIGGSPEVKKHLEDLGFHVGGEISVVNTIGGNLIVNVKECRVAVSRELANTIIISALRAMADVGIGHYDKKEERTLKTLRDAKIGETVTVVKIHGEGAVKRRIMDMGITKHVEIYVRKVAPLGDPVELTVRGYELSLRKADAEMVEVL